MCTCNPAQRYRSPEERELHVALTRHAPLLEAVLLRSHDDGTVTVYNHRTGAGLPQPLRVNLVDHIVAEPENKASDGLLDPYEDEPYLYLD